MTKARKTKTGAAYKRQSEDPGRARRVLLERMAKRFDEVRRGEIAPEGTIEETRAIADRIRQRIERRKSVKDELMARMDEEIARDEALVRELEERAKGDVERVAEGRKKAEEAAKPGPAGTPGRTLPT